MPQSNTGRRRVLPRKGINAVYFETFSRDFPNNKLVQRIQEDWELTQYFADPHFVREWNNPLYQTTQNFFVEEWNLTQYTSVLKVIEPGYTGVSEPWNLTTYSNSLTLQDFWEFTTQYVVDSIGAQFFEEWEFATQYVSDSNTSQFFEEWEFTTSYISDSNTSQLFEEWES